MAGKTMRKQTLAHIACVYVFIVIAAATLLPIVLGIQQQHFPADYLVPPPLPTPQHLRHQNAPTHQTAETVAATSQTSINAAEQPGFMSRVARWFGLGAADQNQVASDGKQAYNYAQPLGADGKPCNQCNKYPWVPMFPHALQYPPAAAVGNQNIHQSSAVPQHQSNQHYEAQASQKFVQQQPLPFVVGKAQLPIKQRAVQFNFPTIYQTVPGSYKAVPGVAKAPIAPPPFLPLHIPKLNLNALPPIYNAQPFRVPYLTPATSTTTTTTPTESSLGSVQQLPTTEPAHFAENIGAHSELQADRVRPAQTHSTPARNPDPSFEIVKSHQITDFVSSVEYPITFEQSPSIDLGQEHIPAIQETPKETVATVPYQHETLSPNLHKHLPASQILTDLGSFSGKQQTKTQNQQTQQAQSYPNAQTQWQTQSQTQPHPAPQHQSASYHTATQQQQQQYTQATQSQSQSGYTQFHQSNEPSTTFYTTPYQPQTQYPQHNYTPPGTTYEPQGGDNFPSASSHNLTQLQGQQQNLNYKPWLPLTQTFVYTTTEPPRELEFSTQLTQLGDVDYLTERAPGTTKVQYSPSVQTFAPHRPEQVKHDSRDTPKRLLDSPILHAHGFPNQPRPFTRDPSELNLRRPAANFVTADIYPNHKQNSVEPSYSTAPWLVTPLPPLPAFTNAPADPTPTSTYSALDASGQYAGMSPPNPPAPARHKDVHQIIIPYTTKNQPRPFEPTRSVTEGNQHVQFSNAAYHKWSAQQNSVDIHEQQESKLVTAKLATETPPTPHEPPRRTTKYVTKILASNLRDLLRREHDVRKHKSNSSSGFDLSKLQKNIDDWTEQEYTSLSHRPSTPTIRGRSKHIPAEYLTTTTPSSARRPKTTLSLYDPSSELPASVNDLQSLLLERGSKRFELNQINDEIDNRLLDTIESETATVSSTATTKHTTTTQHSTHNNGHAAPSFMHRSADSYQPEPEPEPAELWRKAKVSISPQTHEKVYVVTPQPRFFPQRMLSTTSTSTEVPISLRKSPRFVVRPTPGNGTNSQTPASNHYSSELFGLRGLSAYVPAKPVEIIDGNSKVFNIATSAPDNQVDYTATKPADSVEKAALAKKGRRLRSTMSPSPR
ncbi:proteoglycan 4 [Ceratitis capitata]|uniref:proteoglycan 4 n=1 Tax=Ceratitis capitata TaxID=7213 RepID=UPI0006188453|nr:proteoglycan 4 [Ceratitis capitata]